MCKKPKMCQSSPVNVYTPEEAVAEELLSSKELFTTVVLGQDNDTAATSCFHVYSDCQYCYVVTDEFSCQSDKS